MKMREGLSKDIHEEITVRAARRSVRRVVEFVSTYARGMAFTEERIGRIEAALEEALGNIIRFACPDGTEKITVTCRPHEMGAILLNIIDTGKPFNMLLESTFPEIAQDDGERPSTKVMKRAIKDVEYRRDGAEKRNILAWVVSK